VATLASYFQIPVRISPPSNPSQIEFRDSLPKSTVLKVLRRELSEEEVAKQAQLRS
jgi:acyl-CoA synthetase (AMP-forming)/AMP-acid ligase II